MSSFLGRDTLGNWWWAILGKSNCETCLCKSLFCGMKNLPHRQSLGKLELHVWRKFFSSMNWCLTCLVRLWIPSSEPHLYPTLILSPTKSFNCVTQHLCLAMILTPTKSINWVQPYLYPAMILSPTKSINWVPPHLCSTTNWVSLHLCLATNWIPLQDPS